MNDVRKRNKKFTALAALALALIFAFAACGTAGGGTADGGGGGATATPAPGQGPAPAGGMTEWGTPRAETLIVEFHTPIANPGQFNPYMIGTSMGSGIHQLTSAMMWEIDTTTGEQFGEVALGMPRSNEDFTIHYIDIRPGIYWSDGVPLTAHDVAGTINMVLDGRATPVFQGFWQHTFDTVEAVDDMTVRIVTNEPFPRLSFSFGVTIWGNNLRVMPYHIYSQVDDIMSFLDSEPVVAGPYLINSFDPLGNWILFERREDWERSTVGVIHGRMPAPRYVVFRTLGDDMTRQMMAINNEVDVMMEVTPEMLTHMRAQNPNIRAWYEGFPYGTSDDPAAKGFIFNHDIEPFNNRYIRWGIATAINFDEVTQFIFDGIGRASPFPLITATSAFQEAWLRPYLLDWLENDFYIELADGTQFFPYDREFAHRIGDTMRARGHDIPTDAASLYDTFGYGVWRYDPEVATQLLQMGGLELINGNWYWQGEPFTIAMSFLADTEIQAGRGIEIAFNQLQRFGLNVTLESQHVGAWDDNGDLGLFEIRGSWPFGFITRDFFAQVQGFQEHLMAPIGERGAGQQMRWRSANATRIISEMGQLHPDDPRTTELSVELLKYAIEELPAVGFHSGIKFVPVNTTYWTNFPTAENPYNGPWWWWSLFGHITPYLEPTS